MSFWQAMFGLWDGGVWSNLLASLLLGIPAFLRIMHHHKKHARSLASLHEKIDSLKHEKVSKPPVV